MKKHVCRRVRFRIINQDCSYAHAYRLDEKGKPRFFRINAETLVETGSSSLSNRVYKNFADFHASMYGSDIWKELKKSKEYYRVQES